ncbi:MAG: hypothetical protein R3A10_02855 [Caldilineaceae bacterium]
MTAVQSGARPTGGGAQQLQAARLPLCGQRLHCRPRLDRRDRNWAAAASRNSLTAWTACSVAMAQGIGVTVLDEHAGLEGIGKIGALMRH